jgi:hypothetical protein
MTTGRAGFAAVSLSVLVVVISLAIVVSRSPSSPSGAVPAATTPEGSGAIASVASASPEVTSATSPEASGSGAATPTAASPPACIPTDQDKYVYHPDRLEVRAACLRVTGRIAAIRNEADGDLHILLALDPEFTYLLTPANQGVELGDLVIEPVCVRKVTQADAIHVCSTDPDPLRSPLPGVGAHVWMEGRYVFDLEHDSWAELHPLYRWGPAG